MHAMANRLTKASLQVTLAGCDVLLADVARVIEEARRAAARSVNAVMTATYWLIGRRIVEQERGGLLPPEVALPDRHRAEARRVNARRRTADAPVTQLRPRV